MKTDKKPPANAKLGKLPQEKIDLREGWWERLVDYCQGLGVANTASDIYDKTSITRKTFERARSANQFTEFVIDTVATSLPCKTRTELLKILHGEKGAPKPNSEKTEKAVSTVGTKRRKTTAKRRVTARATTNPETPQPAASNSLAESSWPRLVEPTEEQIKAAKLPGKWVLLQGKWDWLNPLVKDKSPRVDEDILRQMHGEKIKAYLHKTLPDINPPDQYAQDEWLRAQCSVILANVLAKEPLAIVLGIFQDDEIALRDWAKEKVAAAIWQNLEFQEELPRRITGSPPRLQQIWHQECAPHFPPDAREKAAKALAGVNPP